MVDGVTVDANIIAVFQKEYLNESGFFYSVLTEITQNFGLAISEIIEHEWRKMFNEQYMNEWLTDEIKRGHIRYVNPFMDPSEIKIIRTKFGLNDSRDRNYIKCANVTVIKYILTHDIDFFDPKKKKSNKIERSRTMNQRKGCLCRYLKKVHGITIGMIEHCCNDLGILTDSSRNFLKVI